MSALPLRAAADRKPGRRATDAQKHLDDLTFELAHIEKENNVLRCVKIELAAEIVAMQATIRKMEREAVEAQNYINQLLAQVTLEQAQRVKLTDKLAITERRIIQTREKK